MKNYRKILSVVMTAAMAASLAACGNSTTNTGSTTNASSSDAAQTSDAAATESAAGTSSDGKKIHDRYLPAVRAPGSRSGNTGIRRRSDRITRR